MNRGATRGDPVELSDRQIAAVREAFAPVMAEFGYAA